MLTQAVILAGGMGSRLYPFTKTNPKALFEINDRPFIDYLIEQIKSFGINRVVILLGYLHEKIQNYLKDGSHLNVEITYHVTPVEYETGFRLLNASTLLDENFLLMYCDNYCPINFNKLYNDYIKNDALIQLSCYANHDNYTKNNIELLNDNKIANYDKSRKSTNLNCVDIGYAIINKKVMNLISSDNTNFELDIYPKIIKNNRLYGTLTQHKYYSIGNWERIEIAKSFFSQKKYVLLDRDGTINVRPPKARYVNNINEFVWIEGAQEAILSLNDNGYIVFIATNQPGIARGFISHEKLFEIHKKMINDIEKRGGKIEKIYYCPHNWDEGCFCRKPKPGLLYQAQNEYHFNLTKSIFFGDDERDRLASEAAGCKFKFVSDNYPLYKAVQDFISEG